MSGVIIDAYAERKYQEVMPGAQAVKSMVGDHFLWTPDGKRRKISTDLISQVLSDARFERLPAMMADGTMRFCLKNAVGLTARRREVEEGI